MTTLAEEIQSGPKAAQIAPLFAAHDWDGVAAILNAPDVPALRAIPVGACMKWASAGPYVRIKAAIADAQSPEPLRASLSVFLEILAHPRDELVDLDDPAIEAMFNEWHNAGVITAAEWDAIYAPPNGRACTFTSRARLLLGRDATAQDVFNAVGGA